MSLDPSTMNENLQLALIESVLELDDVEADDMREHCKARLVELEMDDELAQQFWGQPVPELVDYVLDQGLQEHFDRVTELYLDGGSEVYELTSLFWGGEDGTYDVTSFEGIEACPKLERVTAVAMIPIEEPVSLAPLAELPNLMSVDIDGGAIADAASLVDAPAIEAVALGQFVQPDGTTVDELNALFEDHGLATSVG